MHILESLLDYLFWVWFSTVSYWYSLTCARWIRTRPKQNLLII